VRGTRARAALGPAARDLIFLPDPGLIREPDFYLAWIDARLLGNFLQAGGKAFLKSSIAPSV
jgi:hypothetical protein